jgi:Tol biopolymer transport system component
MSSKLVRRLALALVVAGVLPACGNINDGNVKLIFTDRASVDSNGVEHSGSSRYPALSSDGRYVVFASTSPLAEGVTLNRSHIYRRDTLKGTTILVSAPDPTGTGTEGNADSFTPSISGDGNLVAFTSEATNLVASDTNGVPDVFVRNIQLGTTIRVSVVSGGAESFPSFFGAFSPAISQDGAFVAFVSDAVDLDPLVSLANENLNVFRHEIATSATRLVSISTTGGDTDPAGADAQGPSISADGRFITFHSNATNLVASDANGGKYDIFIADMDASSEPVSLVSVTGASTQSNGNSQDSSVSGDGRFVAFSSDASNLDGNLFAVANLYLRDRKAQQTTLISLNTSGAQGVAGGQQPWISADGRYVAFLSGSSNLVNDDTNATQDAFWRDTVLGITYRLSVRTNGGQATGGASNSSTRVALSHDGRFAAFSSLSPDLVPGDTNGVFDVFIRGPLPTEGP